MGSLAGRLGLPQSRKFSHGNQSWLQAGLSSGVSHSSRHPRQVHPLAGADVADALAVCPPDGLMGLCPSHRPASGAAAAPGPPRSSASDANRGGPTQRSTIPVDALRTHGQGPAGLSFGLAWAAGNRGSKRPYPSHSVASGGIRILKRQVATSPPWVRSPNRLVYGGIHLTAPVGRIAVCLGPECTTRGTTPRCVHGFPTMPRVGTTWTGCAGLRVSDARPVTVRRAGSWAAESAVVRTAVGGYPAQPAPSSRTLARRSPCGSPPPGH